MFQFGGARIFGWGVSLQKPPPRGDGSDLNVVPHSGIWTLISPCKLSQAHFSSWQLKLPSLTFQTQSSGEGVQSAAPWCGQWFYIYDGIVLSQPWYDLLFFEDIWQGLSPNLA